MNLVPAISVQGYGSAVHSLHTFCLLLPGILPSPGGVSSDREGPRLQTSSDGYLRVGLN